MVKYNTQYTKIDDNGDLVYPIESVNEACGRQSKKCVDDEGNVDKAYFAKKQFGKKFIKVKFEDGVSMTCFSGKVTDGVALKDKAAVDAEALKKSNFLKKQIEITWVKAIRDNLNVKDMPNWKDAELMVAFNKWPSSADFKNYDITFRHV